MDSSRWRTWAKVTAVVDIVFVSIGFVGLLCIAFLLSFSTGLLFTEFNPETYYNSSVEDDTIFDNEPSSQEYSGWIVVALLLMICIPGAILVLQMWAAVKLLNSTDRGNTPHDSFGKARFWRNVTVVFFVLGIFGSVIRVFKFAAMADPGFILFMILVTIISLGVRGSQIYAVIKFMEELDILRTPKADEMYKVPMKV